MKYVLMLLVHNALYGVTEDPRVDKGMYESLASCQEAIALEEARAASSPLLQVVFAKCTQTH